MLRSLHELYGYRLDTTDDKLGRTYDFYYDDQTWTLRYLVVDTGTWLPGRKVLISPESLKKPSWGQRTFPISLSKEQVENSPAINTDQPISRQEEMKLNTYYEWTPYWQSLTGLSETVPMPGLYTPVGSQNPEPTSPEEAAEGGVAQPTTTEQKEMREHIQHTRQHSNLRSTREVEGYDIQASNGSIGYVDDFIIDDNTWVIRYLVVDTRKWLPGKRVLIAPSWINFISWQDEDVRVSMTKEAVKESPEYDPQKPINREYEAVLYDYYGRPVYWESDKEPA